MYIITVSDERRRATYFRKTIDEAAAKVGELTSSGAVNVGVRDDTSECILWGNAIDGPPTEAVAKQFDCAPLLR